MHTMHVEMYKDKIKLTKLLSDLKNRMIHMPILDYKEDTRQLIHNITNLKPLTHINGNVDTRLLAIIDSKWSIDILKTQLQMSQSRAIIDGKGETRLQEVSTHSIFRNYLTPMIVDKR